MNLGDRGRRRRRSAVAANRARFAAACGAAPVFLRQVHGTRVVRDRRRRCRGRGAACTRPMPASRPSRASPARCRSPTACRCCSPRPAGGPSPPPMPAGAASPPACSKRPSPALCEAADCAPGELDAWLGACIGPRAFEVGADVLEAFGVAAGAEPDQRRFAPAQPGKWLADLAGLARDRLAAAGVARVSGGGRLHRRGRVTVLFVPARRRHRPHGRRRLDRSRPGPRLRRARRGAGRARRAGVPSR